MYMVKLKDIEISSSTDDDVEKEDMVDDVEKETTLEDLDKGKDNKAYELLHGDYPSDKIIEEQATKDMSEEENMDIDIDGDDLSDTDNIE